MGYVVTSGDESLLFSAKECNRLYSMVRYPVQCWWSVESVLGPLLFLIFILNKSPSSAISKTMRFADDCILYRLIHDQNDCIILPKDLDALADLDMLWGCNFIPKDRVLSISKDTTHQVKYNYTLKGHTLESIMAAKYLGLTLPEMK